MDTAAGSTLKKSEPKEPRKSRQGHARGIGTVLGAVVAGTDGRIVPNVAYRALKLLGDSSDGNAALLAVLSCDPSPTEATKKFIESASLEVNSRKGVGTIAKDLGTPVAEVFLAYARGVKALGHAQVVEKVSSTIASRIDSAIHSLMDQAVPNEIRCEECHGGESRCLVCNDTGVIKILPKFWPFAQKQIYELAQYVDKGPGINITNQTTVAPKFGLQFNAGDILTKLISASDAVVGAISAHPIEAVTIDTNQNLLEMSRDKGSDLLQDREGSMSPVPQEAEAELVPVSKE